MCREGSVLKSSPPAVSPPASGAGCEGIWRRRLRRNRPVSWADRGGIGEAGGWEEQGQERGMRGGGFSPGAPGRWLWGTLARVPQSAISRVLWGDNTVPGPQGHQGGKSFPFVRPTPSHSALFFPGPLLPSSPNSSSQRRHSNLQKTENNGGIRDSITIVCLKGGCVGLVGELGFGGGEKLRGSAGGFGGWKCYWYI